MATVTDQTPGIVHLDKVQARCPGCGKTTKATARDGVVKGYCARSRIVVEAQIVLH